MPEQQTRSVSDSRPALHVSRSFTRMPASPSATSPRKRASTLQDAGIPAIPEARHIDGSVETNGNFADVFENREDDEHATSSVDSPNPELKLPSTFDELPIEIRSLTERFLESLSAKVHPTPLSADALSDLFQDFYERAASQISTHIAILSARIGRGKSRSGASTPKIGGKVRTRTESAANRSDSPAGGAGGEMLTASEVADRRKARRMLELKRLALEEAVERGVCEKVYGRIWKHRSTDDDARDEKLRSRTAALSLVGIGLKELHMDSDPAKADLRRTAEEREEEIHLSLADAREALQRMDDEHYPLGKLQHLTAAHKSIVETLSQLFPSSSSADEILPTLIYTLITSPPEGINVVSNLQFIQRFRATDKVDGEAGYCLVNLEAAISFLETVDLSSLRADELPEGPLKSSSRPSTPTSERQMGQLSQPTPARTLKPGVSPISVTASDTSNSSSDIVRALPSPRTPSSVGNRPPLQQRRLSTLMQQQADRLEAGRDNFLNAADKVYDSINGSLENSLQFVFGRFKEQVGTGDSPLPKTLEDARKLVSSPTVEEQEEALNASGRSTPSMEDPLNANAKTDNKMLELISGRKQLRDRSVDSARSGGSGKRVAFAAHEAAVATAASKEKPKEDAMTPGNLLASMNPLNRFAVPSFPRFGRQVSSSAQPTPTVEKGNKLDNIVESPRTSHDTEAFPALEKQRTTDSIGAGDDDLNAREALAELKRIKPPKKRFLEVAGASELRIGEVEELLRDYRRLAKALGEAVAS